MGVRRQEKLRCRQAVGLLTEYLEGALSPREQSRLEGHLQTCAGCRTYLGQLGATISALDHAPPGPPDPAVGGQLIELYRAYHVEPGSGHPTRGTKDHSPRHPGADAKNSPG
jgi:anti-sigma factor RsiW